MARKADLWLAAPTLLMILALYAYTGTRNAQRNTTPLHPVLRHGNVLYVGCAVGGPMDLPDGSISACDSEAAFTEADLGPRVGTVTARANTGDANLLLDDEARHVPPDTALFAFKRLSPAARLAGRTANGWLWFVPHPVSNARTLGDVLLQASRSVRQTTLNVRTVSMVSQSDPSRRVVVDARRDVDALVIPTLAAPIDWQLAPGGDAYDLAFAPPDLDVIHMTYYPETGLLVVQLDLLKLGTVGIPTYAPAELRTRLDGLVRSS